MENHELSTEADQSRLPRLLLGVVDAAEVLGVSPSTVRRLVSRGQLTPVRVGARVLFRPEALAAFAERTEGEVR